MWIKRKLIIARTKGYTNIFLNGTRIEPTTFRQNPNNCGVGVYVTTKASKLLKVGDWVCKENLTGTMHEFTQIENDVDIQLNTNYRVLASSEPMEFEHGLVPIISNKVMEMVLCRYNDILKVKTAFIMDVMVKYTNKKKLVVNSDNTVNVDLLNFTHIH